MIRKIFLFCLIGLAVACGSKDDDLEETTNEQPKKIKNLSLETRVKTAPDGPYVEKFPDGKIEIEGTVSKGKREGTWTSYFPDGSKKSESSYIDGVRTGKTVSWYPNGVTRYVGYYTEGKQSGNWIYYNEDGSIAKEQSFKE